METNVCVSCQRPKANVQCGLCEKSVCKKCVEKMPENAFSFLAKVPPELTHRNYCPPCYFEKVAGPRADYDANMRRAKRIWVFKKEKGEETRLMNRHEKPIHVEACGDQDETLLRLAFFAAERGFNALIDMEVTSSKVRNFGYQTLTWRGVGVPTMVDDAKMQHEDRYGR